MIEQTNGRITSERASSRGARKQQRTGNRKATKGGQNLGPAAQLAHLRQGIIAGFSVCKITAEHGSHENTTSATASDKIQVAAWRKTAYATVQDALGVLRSAFAREPNLAFRFLCFVGAIPSREETAAVAGQQMSDEERLNTYRFQAAMQLGLIAWERREVYGTELPVSDDELNRRIEEAKKKGKT